MSLTKTLRIVNGIMQKRPLLFNSMVYGFFYTSAEFIRQSFSKMSKVKFRSLDSFTSRNYTFAKNYTSFIIMNEL